MFSDDNGYSHLSQEAHWFMGGLLKHIHSLCAITNPSTNSFKRLVPGFEAPVTVGYATSNRSAVIRIPAYAKTPNMRRFELRNPDATCNPYFCYAALLMAGLDGIEKEMELPPCIQGNLFGMEPETLKNKHVERIPETLGDAIEAYRDNSFIREILGEHIYVKYLEAKEEEWRDFRAQVTDWEVNQYLYKY